MSERLVTLITAPERTVADAIADALVEIVAMPIATGLAGYLAWIGTETERQG